MRSSLYVPITSLFLALLCMGTQCDKFDDIETKYNFIEKVDLFPTQKVYKTGDTIWLKYSNSDGKLFDGKTRQEIIADTLALLFQISLNARYNTPISPSGGFCDFITPSGINVGRVLSDRGDGLRYNFGCNTNDPDAFIIGVVPIQKGIYSLDLGSAYISSCPNRISGFPPSTIEYRFNVTDGNKDVYLSIPSASRGESPKGATEKRIDDKTVYVFQVE